MIELQNIRSRINPWERSKMPPYPDVITEEAIAEYVRATKPFVERGKVWASISPVVVPLFEITKFVFKLLYYFYVGFWVPCMLYMWYSVVYDPPPDVEPMSAGMAMIVCGFLILMGSPIFLIHRRIKNIIL